MDVLSLVGLILFISYLVQRFLRPESKQVYISYAGSKALPKLVLKIAGVNINKSRSWEKLSSDEKKRVKDVLEKLRLITWAHLTFLSSQNLIHVRLQDRSYFLPLDHQDNDFVTEELGTIGKDTPVQFVLNRRKRGMFKSPILTGYLATSQEFREGKKEVEILYEFPEDLINKSFFTNGMKESFNLEEDTIADYHTNDLGDGEGIHHQAYDQKHNSGSMFRFQVF